MPCLAHNPILSGLIIASSINRPPTPWSGPERAGRSPAQTPQRRSLVQGHVIGLVALDRVLGAVLARVVDVALVVHVSRVHLDDPPAHAPGLRVPAHVITDLEPFHHGS